MDTAELAAVAAALAWTFSSLTFGLASRAVGAAPVNQFRLLAAVPVMLLVHALTVGGAWPSNLSSERTWTLAVSGVMGLAIGDLVMPWPQGSACAFGFPSIFFIMWPGLARDVVLTGILPAGRRRDPGFLNL
jgi:hypothetical protein